MNSAGLRVVSGVLFTADRQRILMGLRKPGGKRPSLWELPGGKVEPGESCETALVREWLEELDLAIKPVTYIATSFLEMEVSFHIDLYVVEPVDAYSSGRAIDHTELRWVSPIDAIQNLPCSPAFYMHWPRLRDWVTGRGY